MSKSITIPNRIVKVLDLITTRRMYPQRWVVAAGIMMFDQLSHEEQVEKMQQTKSYSKNQITKYEIERKVT
jgi:hypothetical protein